MRLNDNIAALNTYTSLLRVNKKIDGSMKKISSGVRINSVADDAAGMSISNKMKDQIKRLNMANRNSMDGISLVQTADGSLNEVNDMLQRMRELSVQAANGILEASDRLKIQDDIEELKKSINAVSEQTEFNNIKILNGGADLLSKSGVSNVLKVTDTVTYGNYKVILQADAEKATYTSSTPTNGFTFPDGALAGKITINNETIEILSTDTEEEAFAKIRSLAEINNLEVTRGTGGALIEKIEAKYSGSKNSFKISSANTDLLDALGFNSNAVYSEGKDTVIKLIRNSDDPTSVISDTAVYTADGNRITITDVNNQKIVLDLDSDSSQKKFSHFEQLISDALLNAENLYNQIAAKESTLNPSMSFNDINNFVIELKDLVQKAFDNGQEASMLINNAVMIYPELKDGTGYESHINNINNHNSHSGGYLNDVMIYLDDVLNTAATDLAGAIGKLEAAYDPATELHMLGQTTSGGGLVGCAYEIADSADKIIKSITAPGGAGMPMTVVTVNDYALNLQIGSNKNMELMVRISAVTTETLEIDRINCSTIKGASESITACDNALAYLSQIRSKVGAYQTRLEHTIRSLDITSENTSSALSRIYDTDVAWEVAVLTQNNVIAQAAMSIMAQANQRPQMLLQIMG